MIETILLKYMSGRVDMPFYMEEPEDPPKEYGILEKTGGGGTNKINTAVFAVQSYGNSLEAAASRNLECKKAMLSAPDNLDSVSRVSLNSDYNYTDTETKRYRYQAVFNITYFEEV